MYRIWIKKTFALFAIIWMFFAGVDPATFVYVVYKEVQEPRHSRVVDKMYLASKNPNVVDSHFKQMRTVSAAINPAEKEYMVDVGPITGSGSANYVYVAFFNPTGSGRTASIKRVGVRSNTIGTASNYVNLTVRRISTSSGGTQIATSSFVGKNSTASSSVIELRSTGPSVTLSGSTDSRILGQPLSGAVGSYFSKRDITFGQNDEKIVLQPGEGIAVYQEAAGSANSRILVYIEWDETTNAPSAQNEYLFAYPRVEVNVGANYVYNSFFNPAGSGKTSLVKRIWFGTETCDAASVYTNNIKVQRITAASGGTQITSADIPKKHTDSPDSSMEFRRTGVTVSTYGTAVSRIGMVTPCGAVGEAGGWQEINFQENDEKLTLQAGEGIALISETAGDADQIVRMIIEWEEIDAANTPSAEDGFIWSSSRVESAAAANTTYYSFFNPSGSGKTAVIKRLAIRINADGASSYVSFSFRRITSASGGTQVATSTFPQKHTDSASSTIQIRWCGAACASAITAGYAGSADSKILSVTSPGAAGQTIGLREIVLSDNEEIILQPGEGIGLYNDGTADADHYVKMMIEWDEETNTPTSQGEYILDIGSVAGNTANPYTYATFFNPSGSGKTAIIRRLGVRVDTVNAAVYIPMQVRRITAASAGTQITAANIPEKHTGTSNSIMEVRRTGVTTTYDGTADSKILGIQTPGAVASSIAGNSGYKESSFENREYIVLRPGEGIGFYQDAAGDVDLRVRLLIEWDEEASAPTSANEFMITTGPINQSTTQGYVYTTFFNPSGSSKNYLVKSLGIRANRSGAASNPVYNPIAVRPITSQSGGSQIATSSIPRKNTATATSTAIVRTTGVTASFFGATSSRVLGVTTPGVVNQEHGLYESVIYYGDEYVLKEGEGIALYQEQTQGDANVRYRFLLEWEERSNAAEPQTITFSISTSTVYFGIVSSAQARYASSTNRDGSSAEVEAHTFSIITNAANGYTVTVRGQTLTSQLNTAHTVNAIGSSNTASSPGSEQFGLRITASGGSGSVTSPYAASGFAYAATATTSSQVASAEAGDNATTTYSVRYLNNISTLTEAGSYSANLVYTAAANF